jgi:hypothetical protein
VGFLRQREQRLSVTPRHSGNEGFLLRQTIPQPFKKPGLSALSGGGPNS